MPLHTFPFPLNPLSFVSRQTHISPPQSSLQSCSIPRPLPNLAAPPTATDRHPCDSTGFLSSSTRRSFPNTRSSSLQSCSTPETATKPSCLNPDQPPTSTGFLFLATAWLDTIVAALIPAIRGEKASTMTLMKLLSNSKLFIPTTSSTLSFPRYFSTSKPQYIVKVGIPEFLTGIGKGVETHAAKLESEIGDFHNLLVTRTLKLKKIGIPCKHRKLILKYAHKYRVGLWRPRFLPVKT